MNSLINPSVARSVGRSKVAMNSRRVASGRGLVTGKEPGVSPRIGTPRVVELPLTVLSVNVTQQYVISWMRQFRVDCRHFVGQVLGFCPFPGDAPAGTVRAWVQRPPAWPQT